MKLIVGAALASWFLMAPPIDTGWNADFDPSIPLSQWSVVKTYDTAQQCYLVRYMRIMNALRELDGNEDQIKRARRHKLLIWDYLWECHSSNDADLRHRD